MHRNFLLTLRKQKRRIVSKNSYVTRAKHLHVLGMCTDAVDQLIGLDLTGADFVNGSEQRELLFHVLSLKHVVDLFSGDWALINES